METLEQLTLRWTRALLTRAVLAQVRVAGSRAEGGGEGRQEEGWEEGGGVEQSLVTVVLCQKQRLQMILALWRSL